MFSLSHIKKASWQILSRRYRLWYRGTGNQDHGCIESHGLQIASTRPVSHFSPIRHPNDEEDPRGTRSGYQEDASRYCLQLPPASNINFLETNNNKKVNWLQDKSRKATVCWQRSRTSWIRTPETAVPCLTVPISMSIMFSFRSHSHNQQLYPFQQQILYADSSGLWYREASSDQHSGVVEEETRSTWGSAGYRDCHQHVEERRQLRQRHWWELQEVEDWNAAHRPVRAHTTPLSLNSLCYPHQRIQWVQGNQKVLRGRTRCQVLLQLRSWGVGRI